MGVSHLESDNPLRIWIRKQLECWKSDRNLQEFVANCLMDELEKFLLSKDIKVSREELMWLARTVNYVTFNGELISIFVHALADIHHKNPYDKRWLQELSFKDDVVKFYIERMKNNATLCKWFGNVGAFIIYELDYRVSGQKYEFNPDFHRYLSLKITSDLKNWIKYYFYMAVYHSKDLFSDRMAEWLHLHLLAKEISSNKSIEEKHRENLRYIIYNRIDRIWSSKFEA
jgi:hypothetical protein